MNVFFFVVVVKRNFSSSFWIRKLPNILSKKYLFYINNNPEIDIFFYIFLINFHLKRKNYFTWWSFVLNNDGKSDKATIPITKSSTPKKPRSITPILALSTVIAMV